MSVEGLSIDQAMQADWSGDEVIVEEREPEAETELDVDEQDEIQDADPTADEEEEALDEVTASDEEEADEEDDGEDGPDEDQVTVAVEIPKSWGDDEAKAKFIQMPPELQQYVASREEERDKATQRILSESGQERKKAVEATKALGTFAQRADQVLQQIESNIQQSGYDQWTAQDWYRLSAENPDLYSQHKAYSDMLNQQRTEAMQVKQNADLAQQESFAEEQANLLKQHKPEVLEARAKLSQYLSQTYGYTPDQVRSGSAADQDIAYKAMLYDEMNASAKANASKSKPSKPAPKGIKASAGQTSTSRQRKKATAKKNFAKNPSMRNALDAMPDF
jgi:hypothetical protein